MRRPRAGDETLLPSTRAVPAACRKRLTSDGYSQGAGARQERPGRLTARTRKARPGAGGPFTTVREAERRGAQMSPGIFDDVRVARRGARAHLRKEVRTLNRRRQR